MGVIRSSLIFLLLLMLLSALPGGLSSAQAQQQEKRIALVVGNGAYAKAPLATAANDAGLIAQTLQAAGFDVVGARDLDGDTLRRSFRDFIQKAEASGPDTVAMVYLAGYGMQLAGENYFIPVDSTINRDTDIPTEGMRISDYVRQLVSLPLKAGVVVLDAARQQPFIEGCQQPLASGLALVEPDAHMLIALCAPRLTFISYGVPERGDSNWLDQEGSYIATIAAGPVFRLLGARDTGERDDYRTAKMPPVNTGLLGGELLVERRDEQTLQGAVEAEEHLGSLPLTVLRIGLTTWLQAAPAVRDFLYGQRRIARGY